MADDLSCKVNVSALSEQDDEQLPSPGPDSLKHLSDKKVEEGKRVEEWETPQDKAKATKDLLTQIQGPFRFLSLQEKDEPKQQGQDEHDLYLLPKPRDPLESFKERHPVSDKLYNFITCLADAVFKECEKSREARDMLGTELFLGLDEAAGKVFMYFGFLRYSEETVKFNFSAASDLVANLLREVWDNPKATHIPSNLVFAVNVKKYSEPDSAAKAIPFYGMEPTRQDSRFCNLIPDLARCLEACRKDRLCVGSLFSLYINYRLTAGMTADLEAHGKCEK